MPLGVLTGTLKSAFRRKAYSAPVNHPLRNRMNLVFISSSVPLAAPASGFDIANRVIFDALLRHGHRVTAMGFAPPGAALAYPEETVVLGREDFTTAAAGGARKAAWLVRALARRTSVASAKMLGVSRRRFADALGHRRPFDALVLNSVQLPGAFLHLLKEEPSVYVAHNVEHRSAAENARSATRALERYLFHREHRCLEWLETALCRRARHVFALSETDRAELAEGKGVSSSVLPLVTDIAPPPPTHRAQATHDIGLIGTWTWQPNRVGLTWFLDEVVPHLGPDVTIAIAGNLGEKPPVNHPGLRFMGRVEDARAFIRGSGVVALASRGGTGVQLKTIETFEMGLPSVATSSALRGVAAIPANCTAADDPKAFAEALIRQVEAARQGRDLIADGRQFHRDQLRGLDDALAAGLAGLRS